MISPATYNVPFHAPDGDLLFQDGINNIIQAGSFLGLPFGFANLHRVATLGSLQPRSFDEAAGFYRHCLPGF